MKNFFPLLITKEVKWSTSVAHSFIQKEQHQQTKNTKTCRKNLVWILFSWLYAGMRWWHLGLLVKTFIAKVLIYTSYLSSGAFNATTKGSSHSSVTDGSGPPLPSPRLCILYGLVATGLGTSLRQETRS